MFEPIGPVSGTTGSGLSWAMAAAARDAQAHLRAHQKANGDVPASSDATETARPVLAVTAVEATDQTTLRLPVIVAFDTPKLTGPRPTFDQTPLEEMKCLALKGSRPEPGKEDGLAFDSEAQRDPNAPYGDRHEVEPSVPSTHLLDITT
ncbi:hypothetical protein [Oceaniglobus ichthyenteri]|uniref:hypothetical protein n=1 Tax=Oceaniglobus ichthyenteri TaxID=2136177 RepID=UPI000D3D0DC5|nr:hypothetical protein [Oceaniglobus ichthyenteri]